MSEIRTADQHNSIIMEATETGQQGASNMETPDTNQDRVIWRRELQIEMHVSSETVRRWERDHKLPPPDVKISNRTKGWKLSTLRAAGILLA